ncbi:hypothetical protein PY254_10030 [Rhodanobacter sp. AS-Z3]|uniref:hypothetical protein n=1 Tax=Rhodanobacter sp. AS-Z3 TaxID=3031330 RepID=UPI00247896F4|nr:hypothetical protein [Rhodanobacter sp. AS-Z3]WEN13595.1 hypothetical protein PY254_10030 [Rhodanobacter sp. AS-Z3]
MKTHNLIASAAAILLTAASLSLVSYNVDSQQAATHQPGAAQVTNLPAVQVRPSAAEMRAAALLPDAGTAAVVPGHTRSHVGGSATSERVALLGSALVMPYYSFGNNFGRVGKE